MLPEYIDRYIDDNKMTLVEVLRVPDRGLRRSYVILCEDKNQKKYCFKIFDSKDQKAKERFIDEVRNTKLIRRFIPRKYKSWIPEIVFSDLKIDKPYCVIKYAKEWVWVLFRLILEFIQECLSTQILICLLNFFANKFQDLKIYKRTFEALPSWEVEILIKS